MEAKEQGFLLGISYNMPLAPIISPFLLPFLILFLQIPINWNFESPFCFLYTTF